MALVTPDKHGLTLMVKELKQRIDEWSEAMNPNAVEDLQKYSDYILSVIAKMPSEHLAARSLVSKPALNPRSRVSMLGAESGSSSTSIWKLLALAAASGGVGYYAGKK